jgi:urease accessory protein
MIMPSITDPAGHVSRLRLWQLISPALPVGAYAYSAGQEYAVTAGWVHDEDSAAEWIIGLLMHSLAGLDVPVLVRLYDAWQADDEESVNRWTRLLLAARESAELQAEDRHLGGALARLLFDLGLKEAESWRDSKQVSFATLFALATARWAIPSEEAAQGYLWAWCENQVAAAIKLVPLGQTAGQRILSRAAARIPLAVESGRAVNDEDIGMLAPGLGIASALHETQYSRLFRS